MRTSLLLAAAATAALSFLPAPARAAGGLLSTPQGSTAPTVARIVVSGAGGRTTRWTQLRLGGASGAIAWLVPVRPGATVDVASRAWIEALESATATRVLPPDATPLCPMKREPEVVGEPDPVLPAAEADRALAPDLAALETQLAEWGFAIPSAMQPRVRGLYANGWQTLALLYAGQLSPAVTPTVRVTDDGPTVLPLALTRAGSVPLNVTAMVFGVGRARFGAGDPVAIPTDDLLWTADGTSTFVEARTKALLADPSRWAIASAEHAPLFGGYTLPRDLSPTPSLLDEYLRRAARYGEVTDPAGCAKTARARAIRSVPLGLPCPRGDLAKVPPVATCTEPTPVEPGAVDPFRCGPRADDLALALGGLDPSTAWLTRAHGVVPAEAFGEDVRLTMDGTLARLPVVEAGRFAPCADAGGTFVDPGPAPSGTSGRPGSGGPRPPQYAPPPPVEVESSGCGGNSSAGGSCSGDTSTTADDSSSGDSCGGGTSEGDSSSSDSCGSDTSDGSSSSDSCGTDSSDDSSSDSCDTGDDGAGSDGCSSGDSDSEGCSSGGGSGDESKCTVSRRARGRSPVSRWAYGLVALAAIVRRLRRPRAGA